MVPKSLKEQSTKVVNYSNLTGRNKQGWKGETAQNTSARTQLFQLNIHKQPWEIFSGTTRDLILGITHLKSSWFSACKFPFKWILLNTLVFKHSFSSFALGGASISPHTVNYPPTGCGYAHAWGEESANIHRTLKARGCWRAGKVDASVLCADNISNFSGLPDWIIVGIPGARSQEARKAGKMGGQGQEDSKGFTRSLQILWRNSGLLEHRHEKGFLSVHGVPKRVIFFSFFKSDFKLYFVLGYSW